MFRLARHHILAISLIILLITASYSQSQTFSRGLGIGAALGGPDGLSLKTWTGDHGALSGLITFTLSENRSSFYTHLDYNRHKFYDELEWDIGRLLYYYGGGIGYEWNETGREHLTTIRMPSGFGFLFEDIPLELFFELAPTFNISREFHFYFNGNFGFRYYLN